MADNEIDLKINVEADKAQKQIKKFSEDSEKSILKVSNAFALLGTALAGAAFIKGFNSAISAAKESDRAIQKLNVSLANTGDFTVQASKDIQDFAASIESLTGITDESVLSAFSLAKTFGITNKQAKDLTQAAVDLAAATGTDLDTAVKQLGGTYSGTAGKLSKLSPEFRKLTEAQLRNGEAIDLVNKKFAGTAAALSGDFEGSVNKVGIAFGNIFEAFGKVITQNPAVLIVLEELAAAFNDIAGAVSGQQGTFSSALTPILTFVAELGTIISGIGSVVLEIAQAVTAGLLIVAKGFVNLVGAVLETLLSPLQAAKKAIGIFAFEVISILQKVLTSSAVTKVLELTGANVLQLQQGLQSALVQAANAADIKLDSPQFITDLQESLEGITVGTVAAFDTSIKAIDRLGQGAATAALKTRGLNTVIEDTTSKIKNSKGGLDEATTASKNLTASLEALADKYKGSIDKLRSSTQEIQKSLEERGRTAEELIDIERQRATQISQNAAIEADALFRLGKLNEEQLALIAEQIALNEQLADVKKEAAKEDLRAAKIRAGFATAGEVTGQVFNGEEGARQFLSATSSKIADAFAPGAGAFVGPLITALSKGGDFAKSAVKEFVEAVPVLIDKIVEALPVIVDTLVDTLINKGGIVKIAVAFAKALVLSTPLIAQGIVNSIIEGAPIFGRNVANAFKEFTGEFFAEFGAKISENFKILADQFVIIREFFSGFVETLRSIFDPLLDALQALQSALENADPGKAASKIGGAIGDVVGSVASVAAPVLAPVAKALGFSEGGEVPQIKLPSGDRILAGFNPGELVVPTDTVGDLKQFLADQNSTTGGGSNEAMLVSILRAVQAPIVVQAEAKVNQSAFADIILQLNRQNARLA